MSIGLFVTCLTDTLYPQTGKAIVNLLDRLGYTNEFPKAQACCGQAHFNTGYRREAMAMLRHNVEAFAPHAVVVTPSASCAGMIRHQYPILAEQYGDPELREKVTELAPRVYELSELLIDELKTTDVGAYYPPPRHPPPHLSLAAGGRAPTATGAGLASG